MSMKHRIVTIFVWGPELIFALLIAGKRLILKSLDPEFDRP